jgi:hypothetical protein
MMVSRPDPWLIDSALIVRRDEARALWQLLQPGLAEWRARGSLAHVESVLLRLRALAESADQGSSGEPVGWTDDRCVGIVGS